MTEKFKRKIEDFTCLNCFAEVVGNGFTNHCPKCLWCKHVDIHPGDRSNPCQGAMEPIGVELEKGKYLIVHQCEKCGISTRTRTQPDDDIAGFLANML